MSSPSERQGLLRSLARGIIQNILHERVVVLTAGLTSCARHKTQCRRWTPAGVGCSCQSWDAIMRRALMRRRSCHLRTSLTALVWDKGWNLTEHSSFSSSSSRERTTSLLVSSISPARNTSSRIAYTCLARHLRQVPSQES